MQRYAATIQSNKQAYLCNMSVTPERKGTRCSFMTKNSRFSELGFQVKQPRTPFKPSLSIGWYADLGTPQLLLGQLELDAGLLRVSSSLLMSSPALWWSLEQAASSAVNLSCRTFVGRLSETSARKRQRTSPKPFETLRRGSVPLFLRGRLTWKRCSCPGRFGRNRAALDHSDRWMSRAYSPPVGLITWAHTRDRMDFDPGNGWWRRFIRSRVVSFWNQSFGSRMQKRSRGPQDSWNPRTRKPTPQMHWLTLDERIPLQSVSRVPRRGGAISVFPSSVLLEKV